MHCFITDYCMYHETRKSFQLQVTNHDFDVMVKNLKKTAMAYLMLINYID